MKLRDFSKTNIDLNDKVILITGGTGSFGNSFCDTVIRKFTPKKLIIYSRDEFKQMQMQKIWPENDYDFMRYFIGDVRDYDRLSMAMRGVDYVIHAAALKHVPAAEYNPFECVNTNILGAENIVRAAIHNNVKKVIALSTDKAANPVNLYGATKLASDKIFTAANHLSGDGGTHFSVVRYGNVIGSRGSVVPYFNELLSNGSQFLPITDERMTRFWITLSQGVWFVLSSLEMMKGSEIFVPKIPSMKIIDLAKSMAPDLPCKTIGIRPGEKLHEVMITEDDCQQTVELDDRYIIGPSFSGDLIDWYLNKDGINVEEGFSYRSDKNSEWIDIDSLKKILKSQGIYKSKV